MIRREIFKELRQLDNIIQNATVTYDGESFTYKDACARWENECFENDILNLDYIMDDVSTPTQQQRAKVFLHIIDSICVVFRLNLVN